MLSISVEAVITAMQKVSPFGTLEPGSEVRGKRRYFCQQAAGGARLEFTGTLEAPIHVNLLVTAGDEATNVTNAALLIKLLQTLCPGWKGQVVWLNRAAERLHSETVQTVRDGKVIALMSPAPGILILSIQELAS